MFFTFFKLHKWCQIAPSVSFNQTAELFDHQYLLRECTKLGYDYHFWFGCDQLCLLSNYILDSLNVSFSGKYQLIDILILYAFKLVIKRSYYLRLPRLVGCVSHPIRLLDILIYSIYGKNQVRYFSKIFII